MVLGVREAHLALGDALALIRLEWLEARIAYKKGDLAEATAKLKSVRDQFVEREIGIDVALSSLELAEMHASQGEVEAAKALLAEAIPILKALRVGPDTVAAMAFLGELVARETVEREIFRRAVAFVRKAQNDPQVRFEPAELLGD